MTIIEGIVELEDFSKENYLKYCQEHGFEQCVYLEDIKYILHPAFFPLNRWFKYDFQPTLNPGDYVGFQVASSTNFERPAVPNLHLLIENVINYSPYRPVFIGTAKDEVLFNSLYPGFRERFQIPEEHWRFGKDTLFQTMSNIKLFSGMVTFSSWTAYMAALQGVPTLEFWKMDQWMFFTGLVRKNLGDPVHYVQDFYLDGASPYMMKIFQYLKGMAKVFYGSFE
jgi:ADP-heptose:LPS heptosyltransferase